MLTKIQYAVILIFYYADRAAALHFRVYFKTTIKPAELQRKPTNVMYMYGS